MNVTTNRKGAVMMRKKKMIVVGTVLMAALFVPSNMYAQKTGRTCATMEVLEQELSIDPERGKRLDDLEEFTAKYVARLKADRSREVRELSAAVRTIPVYVHVVYQTADQNIDAEQIQSQIEVLNQDFRRLSSTPGYGNGADTNIQFVLQPVPAGSAGGGTVDSYGINRKHVDRAEWGYTTDTVNNIKTPSEQGIAPVTPDTHLNMWICNIGGGILGYATLPGGNPDTDGVVILPQAFGSAAVYPGGYYAAPYDKGRTATHEVGHYLNLLHIWGDGGCDEDDLVADTPESDAANYGCATGHVSCGSADMVENYMDYSDDTCMDTYTQGQADRMEACLTSSRAQLGSTGGDDLYEENDSPSDAYDLSSHERTWLSSISGPGIQKDQDFYKFTVPAGSPNLLLDLRFTHAEGNINMALYTSGGALLVAAESADDNEYIDYTLPDSDGGEYLIVLSGADNGNTYNFRWDAVADDKYEENDIMAEAYDLSAREETWLNTIDGSGVQADDDWYKITVPAGFTSLVVDLRFTHADGNLDMSLVDSSYGMLSSTSSMNDNEYLNYTLSSADGGEYWIVVIGTHHWNTYNLRWDAQKASSIAPVLPALRLLLDR